MINIDFKTLCEQIIEEWSSPTLCDQLIKEAIEFITQLCNDSNRLRDGYAELKNNETNQARKNALTDKMKIELHKIRNRLAAFLIANNVISEKARAKATWLDSYIMRHFSEYKGILHMSTQMITSEPPPEPDSKLLPENIPLALAH